LHFIEVKGSQANFEPSYNITPSKLRKVIQSSQYYMKIKHIDKAFCIDALIVRHDEVEFIENVTI
jgi:putative endonuclease